MTMNNQKRSRTISKSAGTVSTSGNAWEANQLFNPRITTYSTPWVTSGYDNAYIVVRVLPMLNPENPEEYDKFYLGGGMFGEMFRYMEVASQVGNDKKVTFTLWDAPYNTTSIYESPYYVVYDYVRNMLYNMEPAQQNAAWTSMMTGSANAAAALSKPKQMGFLPVQLVMREMPNKKPITQTLSEALFSPTVLQLSPAAVKVVEEAATAFAVENEGWDITHPDQGGFLTIWAGGALDPFTKAPGEKDAKRFKARVTRDCPDFLPMRIPAAMDRHIASDKRICDAVNSWDLVFKFRSFAEQAELMSQYIRPDLLVVAWSQEHPEWVTPELRARAKALDEAEEKKREEAIARNRALYGGSSSASPTIHQQMPTIPEAPAGGSLPTEVPYPVDAPF